MKRAALGRFRTSLSSSTVLKVLTAGGALGLFGCGPGAATPIPEPPTLQLGRIGLPSAEVVSQPEPATGGGRHIYGQPGAAPFGAVVRVTNLERKDAAAVASALSDGSFMLTVAVLDGEELRFDWQRAGQRGEPQDALFVADGNIEFHLLPSPRLPCLTLAPGFELDFSALTTQTLTVHNACASEAVLAAPRQRVGLPDFSLQTTLPLTIPVGQDGALSVAFARSQAAAREDTLFVDISVGGQIIRYPLTLLAPAAP